MIRKGSRVVQLTKKVGQAGPTGKVIRIEDHNVIEVEWDDGHTSITSREALVPLTEANRPHHGEE